MRPNLLLMLSLAALAAAVLPDAFAQPNHAGDFRPVETFRVMPDGGRGTIVEVETPSAHGFAGAFTIDDPAPGGDIYQMMVAWHIPDGARLR